MNGYVKLNFKQDIPDSAAARYPIDDGLESRYARGYLDSDHLGVSYLRYDAGKRSAFGHRHRQQEEVYVVTGGSGTAKLDDELVALRQWDVLRVAPAVLRAFEGGPEGLELVVVGSDVPEGGDGERFADFWRA